MKLKSVDDCGTATVEFYCDELLLIAALLKTAPCPFEGKEETGMLLYATTLEESLRAFGVFARQYVDGADYDAANAMLSADPGTIMTQCYAIATKGE